MLRARFVMALVAMLCCATGARAQEIVTIGEGTVTCNSNPIGTYYNYSITEQLYTAEEIEMAGTISSVSFYYMGNADKGLPITMYMKHVDEADLASAGITLADADQVFSGTLSVTTTAGWVTITLDTPFEYNGESNLLIGVVKDYLYYFSGQTWQGTATSATMARYKQNDVDAYDITATVPDQAQANRPNIQIGITPSGPVYKKPTDLIVSDLTSTGATISWTAPEGSPTGYAYKYKKASDADWSSETSVTATSVALSGLEPAKAYNFRVKAVYGTDGESKFVSIKFTTDCDVITTFPWTENFENYASGNFNALCWVNEHIDGNGSNIFKISTSSLGGNSTHQLQLPDMNQGTLTKLVLPAMDLNGNYQFVLDVYRSASTYNDSYASEGIRVFVSADGQIEGATEIGFIPRQYAVSSTIVPAEAAAGWYNYEVPIPMTGTCHIILRGESQYCAGTYMDNFVVELIPTCRKPTNLAASGISARSATLTWTPGTEGQDNWEIKYNAGTDFDPDSEGTLVTYESATTSYTFDKTLEPETQYYIYVRSNCGGGDLSKWSTPVNFTTPELYPKPTGLACTAVTGRTATLGWTVNGEETAWQICLNDDEENLIDADTNPFNVTGLTPETAYTAKVRAVVGNEYSGWSTQASFTTIEAAPTPTDLTLTLYPTKAEASWSSFAESDEMRYAPIPAEGYGEGWLQYDNNTFNTNIGSNTAGERTWGVKYPGSMATGNKLTKVSFYESSYYSAGTTVHINIYSGGDNAPGTLVHTEEVTASGAEGFHEVTFASPVAITPGKPLWITLTVNGTYVMAACQVNNYDNQWWAHNGSWSNMGEDSSNLADYGWMIRGYFESDPSEINWATATTTEKSYDIAGLTPETTYLVQVRGDFGSDGFSEWASSAFTTLAANTPPINLTADVTATTATLGWIDYQDSYNVQYRKAAKIAETLFYDDFENGLDQWTLTAGGEATHPDAGIWYTFNPYSDLGFEAHSGSYCTSSWSWNGSVYNADNWLITPQVTFGGILQFWVRTHINYPDSYEVLLSTGGNATTDFTVTLQALAPAPAVSQWNEVTIDLSAYAGQQGYIAIHHVDNDMNYLLIDDFGIYNIAEAGDWISASADEATLTLTGLTPNTNYEWQVQGIYNSDPTEWSEMASFTTADSYIMTIAAGTFATFYSDKAVTLDASTPGAEFYTVESVTDNTVMLSSPFTAAPANTPLLVYNPGNAEQTFLLAPTTETVDAVTFAPEFQGTATDTTFTDEAMALADYYLLSGGKAFAKVKGAGTLKAHQCWLQFDHNTVSARAINIVFNNGETTGISLTPDPSRRGEGSIYSLDGRRVERSTFRSASPLGSSKNVQRSTLKKGVYIINGKKVVK